MIKNRINLRIADPKLLTFVERKAADRNVSVSSFINDCLRKSMDEENSEYGIEALNKKMDEITHQYNSLVESNNQIVNFVSTVFLTSSVLLQGRINEYKVKNVDPYKFYNCDIREVASKFNFPTKIDFSELDNND